MSAPVMPARACSGCGAPLSRYNPGSYCQACPSSSAAETQAEAASGDVPCCPTCGHSLARGVAAGDVGQRIAELRLDLQLTQQELADKAGVSTSLVAKLESGARKVTGYDMLAALAGALGVPAAVLLEAPQAERTPGGRGKRRARGSWRWQ